MSFLFHVILYQPLFNGLVVLYNILGGSIGLAIIFLTVFIKIVLWPLNRRALAGQKSMQELQPKLAALKEKYKDNKEEFTKATMALYKENKINPLSSCLPLLVQLPFLIAIFQVFRSGLNTQDFSATLYPFIHNPGQFNLIFLGLNTADPNIILAVVVGIFQFFQTKMMMTKRPPQEAGAGAKDEDMAAIMNKQMLYIMPAMTVFIGIKLPSGLMLYWLTNTLLTIAQQYYQFRTKSIKQNENLNQKIV